MAKFLAAVWIVIGAILMIALWGIGQAWVIQKIWLWYMVDKFHLPMVSLVWCYVMILVIRLLLPTPDSDTERWKKNFWAGMVAKSMMWATLLGLAYWLRV